MGMFFFFFLPETVMMCISLLLSFGSCSCNSIIACFDISCTYCRLEHVYYYIKLETELFQKCSWAYETVIVKSKIEDEGFFKLYD